MLKRISRCSLGVVLAAALSVCSQSRGLQPVTDTAPLSPATTSTAVEVLRVEITGVEGTVQVRANEDETWQRAQVGMVVSQDAEFRTSLRSAVRIQIDGGQTITLDRLGAIKVVQAIHDSGKFKTKIGMKYGRTRYDIESAGQENEASISSPSSTLAIRGTEVSLFDQRPYNAMAISLTGRAQFQDAKKRVAFGNKGAGKLAVDVNSTSPAAYALGEAVVDPSIARARTASETGLINQVLSTGASIDFDQKLGIRVVRGGRPLTDAQLIPNLPGTLNFVLRWTSDTNLNLGIIAPGEGNRNTIYPIGGYDVNANGGKIAFDHRGGPNGGIEVTSFPANAPKGTYAIGAQHISGPNTPATVDVFYNGKRIDIRTPDGNVKTARFTGEPIDPRIAEGLFVGFVEFPPADAASSAKVAKAKKKKR